MNDAYINEAVRGTRNPGLMECLKGIGRDFTGEGYGLELLFERCRAFEKANMTPEEHMETLIRSAADLQGGAKVGICSGQAQVLPIPTGS